MDLDEERRGLDPAGNEAGRIRCVGQPYQGQSVSLSADGNTAIVGGSGDNSQAGAAWIWTRSGGVWTQQGSKLVGTGATGNAGQGISVSLSGDGNTAIVGGYADNVMGSYSIGAAWIWTRSGGVWTQQGSKVVAGQGAYQGYSVAVSSVGNTVLVGSAGGVGGAAVWTRSAGVWSQQWTSLVGTGVAGNANQGASASISGDGSTAIIGGPYDNNQAGAAWIFARPLAELAAPTTLTSAWVDGKVSLSWVDASSDETGFKVERRGDPSGTYSQIAAPARNINFHTDASAAGTDSYCYRVRATNGAVDSAYSSESCVVGYGANTAGQQLHSSVGPLIASPEPLRTPQ